METNHNVQVIGVQPVERKVYKYPLEITDRVTISMPQGARVLTVQMQHSNPCLWVWVDPDAPLEERTFRIAGTGHAIVERGAAYIGTFQMRHGDVVFHVFEVLP